MQIAPTHKAIAAYYAELENYRARGVTHELALKTAFQTLLAKVAQERKWTLVPELTLDNGKRPDGAILDGNGYTRGYWEAKDPGDDLESEIAKKIAARYPLRNTIFEDTRRAVLYQAGERGEVERLPRGRAPAPRDRAVASG
jgi:hypothetical protein